MVSLRFTFIASLLGVLLLVDVTLSEQRYHLCQSDLADALAKVCNGMYNGPARGRKRRSMGKKEPGVADECCLSAYGCTETQMKQYCLYD